jgi:hypothetical protein
MAIRPFPEMRELVFRYHVGDLGAVLPELLLAIFWHESRFQNIGQHWEAGQEVGGHGWGFGQVERRVIGMVNTHFRRSYPSGRPLSDQQSIEITSLTLHLQLTYPQKVSVPQALHAYATSAQGRRAALRPGWRPGPMVSGWLACMEALKFLRDKPLPSSYTDPDVVRRIWAALRMAVVPQRTNDAELGRTLPMPARAPTAAAVAGGTGGRLNGGAATPARGP